MCVLLPHSLSLSAGFFLPVTPGTKPPPSASPARAHSALQQLFALPQISVLWSYFCVSFSLWANSSLYRSPCFKSSFRLFAFMKIYPFPDTAAFPRFLVAVSALIEGRRDLSMASSTAALGYRLSKTHPSVTVCECFLHWVITTLSFEYFSWPKFSYFWNSRVAIPSS